MKKGMNAVLGMKMEEEFEGVYPLEGRRVVYWFMKTI